MGGKQEESASINRELSLLEFNRRVLAEAENSANPLPERLRFLSIFNSNLDEFFMVRVAAVRARLEAGLCGADASGLAPRELLARIRERVIQLSDLRSAVYRELLKELEKTGLRLLTDGAKEPEQEKFLTENFLSEFFDRALFPVLTPMAADGTRPFPFAVSRREYLGVWLTDERQTEPRFAVVPVPAEETLPEEIPCRGGCFAAPLSEVIRRNLAKLFPGRLVLACHGFRVVRRADMEPERTAALPEAVERVLRERERGQAVKLDISREMDSAMEGLLRRALRVEKDAVYRSDVPAELPASLLRSPSLRALRTVPLVPRMLRCEDIFAAIRERDILLHHPYDSFQTVVEFLQSAATDPKVLIIKQTLYRLGEPSQIVDALERAAQNGKQVTVLVEVRARFDEENNLRQARRLERAGCHVIYGLPGLKVHGKAAMVVRREEDGLRRYLHFGTGNYNEITARQYTDLGLLTCDEELGEDASDFFNKLSGYSDKTDWKRLTVSPGGLREKFYSLIDREICAAQNGEQAAIAAKINSLEDEGIMQRLYRASAAGVRIELIVRGICCLRGGIPGLSETIRVRSVVGEYLEHSRIFYFCNAGREDWYISSADLMTRNLNRRVELLVPVREEALKKELTRILTLYLSDERNAWLQDPDGTYRRPRTAGTLLCAQAELKKADDKALNSFILREL